MEPIQIHVSPRQMCECGKTVLKLTVEEKNIYDEMIRLSEERSRKAKEEVAATNKAEAELELSRSVLEAWDQAPEAPKEEVARKVAKAMVEDSRFKPF